MRLVLKNGSDRLSVLQRIGVIRKASSEFSGPGARMATGKTTPAGITIVVFLLSFTLFFTGCSSDSVSKTKSIPAKNNTVDAVLQQQKQAADAQGSPQRGGIAANGTAGASGGENGGQGIGTGNAGSVSPAARQPDPDAAVPRKAVYDTVSVYDHVDYDFSKMDKNMMYTQIYNMLKTPDKYRGKIVRMEGTFGHYFDQAANKHYYGAVVMDATACCSTGIEFSRRGQHVYPENYPHIDDEIIVTGRFDSYMEGKELYCHLADAEIQKLR